MYDTLLQEIVDEASTQEEILGILLTGSVARGDALLGCDLDLRFLLTAGNRRKVQPEIRQGIMIERGYADLALAQSKLETNPMEVYAYLDGQILFDPEGLLRHLREEAKERFETYRISKHERDKIAYWLKSAHLKMTVASRAGDLLKATFVASTTSWEILVGLWAINDKPMPPNGSVWVHLKDLSQRPPDIEAVLKLFFCGEAQQRVQTALDLIDWLLAHMNRSLPLERTLQANRDVDSETT